MLINSYNLYNKYVKKISLYDYRLSVIEVLLPNYQNISDKGVEEKKNYITQQVEKMTKKIKTQTISNLMRKGNS